MQDYLIKFSLSLAIFFTFYYLCLRPLTFYQWNRVCLLVYSALCLFIPLINITPWINNQGMDYNAIFNSIPPISVGSMQSEDVNLFQMLNLADVLLILFSTGSVIMTVRLLIRYLSLGKVRKRAALLSTYKNINLYNVSENISPFSFGKSIFVNKDMHDKEELQRIIQHEFVHVKQQHTIDLMFAELICIVNWFNPFAWLLRSAIRQNLEFIADEKVVSNGIDKKEYQYLLLKVIGAPAYGLANHLNFSDLKKRITMMNKMKSAKVHLTKFLFALPLLAVILLAFRQAEEKSTQNTDTSVSYAVIFFDESTKQPVADVQITGIYTGAKYVSGKNGYIVMPQKLRDNDTLNISLRFNKPGYEISERRFQHTGLKNGTLVELLGIRKGAAAGRCSAIMTTSHHSGDNLERDTWSFFKQFMSAKSLPVQNITLDTVPRKKPVKPATKQDNEFTVIDTVPNPVKPLVPHNTVNEKAYIISTVENHGEQIVIVKNKNKKIVESVYVSDWNADKSYEAKYGKRRVSLVQTLGINQKPPLYVIDGVVHTGSSMGKVLPEDIESISVLKDETATKKYGAKGVNGVIEIKLKVK